jgi:TRAP-type C4-dicarboxylate transport system permease small subunit
MSSALRRALDAPVEDAIAGVALVVVVGSVLWGVLTRYLFAQPAAWSYEVATIGFAWLVFFGAAACVRYRAHADIDVLVAMFPPAWQRAVAIFNFWLLALFFGVLAVLFGLHTVDAHKSTTIALNLPRSWIYVPLCLATVAMLVRHVEAWLRPEPERAPVHEANIS